MQSLVLEIVNAHRAQLQGLIEIGGVRKLSVLYERAQQELEARLAGLLRAGQGQTFQAHHLRMVLVQVQDALRGFKSGFAAHLRDTSEMAATLGARHLVGAIKKLERRFTGVEPILRVEEAGVFQGMYEGIEPSLLARHNHLVARYPLETIRRVEEQLSQSLLANETVDQATNRIIGAGGIFGRERYRAARIVRTESAYAYGVTTQASGRELLREIPKLHKRLIATFDSRIGEDSKKLNGQTVPWNEPFVWMKTTKAGVKRVEYFQPPNRPQDREVSVPWRPEYGMGKPPEAGPVRPRMPTGL